jgi:hypothetical protein
VIRDYAQAVESMGYTHILAFDSVVGANPNRPGGWEGEARAREGLYSSHLTTWRAARGRGELAGAATPASAGGDGDDASWDAPPG